MAAKVETPKFSGKSELARYIGIEDRLSGNRPAVAAFLPDGHTAETTDPDEHLSVNSLEVESLSVIAAYHRWRAQEGAGDVALSVHKVHIYSETGKKAEVQVDYSRQALRWEFLAKNGSKEIAYRHRPVRRHSNPLGSPSHCGVEFVRAFSEYAATQFARRMSAKGKFHVLRNFSSDSGEK